MGAGPLLFQEFHQVIPLQQGLTDQGHAGDIRPPLRISADMSVGKDFSKFKEAYSLREDRLAYITTRCRRITRQLNNDFWDSPSDTDHGYHVGSLGRGTADAGIQDIETAFVLPADLYDKHSEQQEGGQSALLQSVKKSIENTYATSEMFDDGCKVLISFREGMSLRVLPVFETTKGSSWTYPNESAGGSWGACNPLAEIKKVNSRDKATNGNLRCLCRMMHVWRDTHKVPMSDLLIDTLAFEFIEEYPHRIESFWFHDRMMRDFFLHLSNQETVRKWRVPGSGATVGRTGTFEQKAFEAYEMSLEAVRCNDASQGLIRRRKWREVFGPLFPLG